MGLAKSGIGTVPIRIEILLREMGHLLVGTALSAPPPKLLMQQAGNVVAHEGDSVNNGLVCGIVGGKVIFSMRNEAVADG